MSCEIFIGLLMASFCMLKISLVFPWKNLYEGPLIPCEPNWFFMWIGVHHSVWRPKMRVKRKYRHRELERQITRISTAPIFSFLRKLLGSSELYLYGYPQCFNFQLMSGLKNFNCFLSFSTKGLEVFKIRIFVHFVEELRKLSK